jgi:hypothetical protein
MGQALKVGRCAIICAASDPRFGSQKDAGAVNEESDRRPGEIDIPKLNDLLSRFNGGMFSIDSINAPRRVFDRLCIASRLIKRRDWYIGHVRIGLLQFLSKVALQHEVRSLEFLINLFPLPLILGPHERPGTAHSQYLDLQELLTSFEHAYGIKPPGDIDEFLSLLLKEDVYPRGPLRFHIPEHSRDAAARLWAEVSQYKQCVPISPLKEEGAERHIPPYAGRE